MEFLVRVKKTAPARRRRDSRQDAGATLKKNEGAIFFHQALEKNGGDDGTRTRGLCRDRAAF
jgi:hypothetical protein